MSIDNPVLPFPAEAPTADPFSAEYPATPGVAPGTEWYEPETPFLDTRYNESPRVDTSSAPVATETTFETPFATEYYGQPGPADRESVQFHDVLTELYDSEFAEVLAELVQDAAATHAEQAALLDAAPSSREDGGRLLAEWLDPLATKAEQLLEAMARTAGQADPATLTEDEVDRLFEAVEPRPGEQPELFEDFLGKLFKKAKGVVKQAVKLAKQGVAAVARVLPIGAILDKIKPLIRPLLDRVLKMGLNRLPASVRPFAATLSRRLLGHGEQPADAGEAAPDVTREEPATPSPELLAYEFDVQAASLLLATEEGEQEYLIAEVAAVPAAEAFAPIAELDRARDEFMERLGQIEQSHDVTPAVENFIPAILAAVRMGISLVGRPNVVKFIAQPIAAVVRRFIGPQGAPALAQAIADTGLRMMSLEAPPADPAAARPVAAAAISALVEDTVREVARLDEEALNDPLRLEAAVTTALNAAAARTMPPALLRPDLPGREASDGNGMWVSMPKAGRTTPRYRKYTRTFEVTLTRQTAAALRTFGGATLDRVLADGRQRLPARARVHLYEAVAGTWLSRIVRLDRAPGLHTYYQLHPLTPEAAGLLFGQPGLGREVAPRFLDSPHMIAVQQRFYYLEMLDGRPSAPVRRPRSSEVNVVVDLRPAVDRTRVFVFLSERQAQETAELLRRRKLAAAFSLVHGVLEASIRSLCTGPGQHLRVVREAEPSTEQLAPVAGVALRWLATEIGSWILNKLLDYLADAVSKYVKTKADEFVAAASKRADGVTLVITLSGTPIQPIIRRLVAGQLPSLTDLPAMIRGMSGTATVQTQAGFRRG